MKHIWYLIIIIIFSGCALKPQPLTFSSPPTQKSREQGIRSPYLQIVYPDAIQQKKLETRSYFTGVANSLNVELGKSIGNVLTKQAALYFDKVDIVNSNTARPARTPRIEVIDLKGDIDGNTLSISGEMTIRVTGGAASKGKQKTIPFTGEGSASVMVLGPFVAPKTLTKAEHLAMQQIIEQISPVFKKMHKKIVLAQKKSRQPKPKPPAKKDLAGLQLGKFHALVIGNTKYTYLPDLTTAGHDAAAVAKLLRSEYGFFVKTLFNATRADIIQSLSTYRQQLTVDDNFMVFYAGHGWLDKEADEGYWLPVDAEPENSVNWVSNASITTALRAMPARHIIVVADSCYSGKLTRGLNIQKRSPSFLQGIYKKKARVVLSSGGLEPVLDSGGTDNHSVFASAFINLLRENKNYLDGMTLFANLRKQVAWNADQIPEYGIIHNAGHDGGDFIFLKKKK